jgi:hypothetical protein
MRSYREIAFRLRQEASNLWLWANPPRLPQLLPARSLPVIPAISVRAESEITGLAEEIRQHRVPLFDIRFDLGPQIHWRRDAISGVETPASYFRRIPYLDPHKAGDHKIIWELNRHQHLVVLARAGDEASRRELVAELESWIGQNPFQRGINWVSALEVAFRALSWIQIYQSAADHMEPQFRRRFLETLYRHGCHLQTNLSVYFSPNTHLLGEAVVLHALGALFPDFPDSQIWVDTGRHWVSNEYLRQVRSDGSHFEQSSYYHVYALDMFLFHAKLAGATPEQRAILARMTSFLQALMGPNGELPFVGDDDGGRLFHPYGPRAWFARDTLREAQIFLNQTADERPAADPHGSRLFEDAGIAVMESGDRHILMDAGPFGPGSAGHSHSDTLSLVVRSGEEWILIDPGTFTYVGDPAWRSYFRGSGSHNTVRVGGGNQAIEKGPFRWADPPRVRVLEWSTSAARDTLFAECAYGSFRHRRRVVFEKPSRLVVTDDIEGPPGDHLVEQFWHLGSTSALRHLSLDGGIQREAWRSTCFGSKYLGPVVVAEKRGVLPCQLVTVIEF